MKRTTAFIISVLLLLPAISVMAEPANNDFSALAGEWRATAYSGKVTIRFTLGEDGTGSYKFESEDGYTEGYEFSMATMGDRFALVLPAGNKANIAVSYGNYVLEGDHLTIDITSCPADGTKGFSYTIDCDRVAE